LISAHPMTVPAGRWLMLEGFTAGHVVWPLVGWLAITKSTISSGGLCARPTSHPCKSRLHGSTLIPWHAGKAMAWDVTVVNTLAESYLMLSTVRWCSRACRSQEICKIFITSTFTCIPAFGFGNT